MKTNVIKIATFILFLFLFCKLLNQKNDTGTKIDIVSKLPVLSRDTVAIQIKKENTIQFTEIMVYQVQDNSEQLLACKRAPEIRNHHALEIKLTNYKSSLKNNILNFKVCFRTNKGVGTEYLSVPVYNPPVIVMNKLYGKEIYTEKILKRSNLANSGSFLKPIFLAENSSNILPQNAKKSKIEYAYQETLQLKNNATKSNSSKYQDFSKQYISSLYNSSEKNRGNEIALNVEKEINTEKEVKKMITMVKKISIPRKVYFSFTNNKAKHEDEKLLAALKQD